MRFDPEQLIISDIYFDRSGYGSKATTLKDAREKDKTITMKNVEYFLERMLRLRESKGVRTVL
jgi:hypothetical protein